MEPEDKNTMGVGDVSVIAWGSWRAEVKVYMLVIHIRLP